MADIRAHWNALHQNKNHNEVSWHQVRSTISLDWILDVVDKDATIIDVGCGVSVLADNLLAQGYQHLSLLEISLSAIEVMKIRLADCLEQVHFYNDNILDLQIQSRFDLWHDRAVFHFLTDEKDQKTYIEKLKQHLKSDGYFLLSTFSPTGPKQCSDLNIVQYDTDKITRLLGADFELIKTTHETHPHPNGTTQDFNYFLFQTKKYPNKGVLFK